MSPQGFNLVWMLSAHRQFSICHQLIAVKLDPSKDQSHFPLRQRTIEYLSFGNRDHRLLVLILDMNMGAIVPPVVQEVH